jgi:hypothetical protein
MAAEKLKSVVETRNLLNDLNGKTEKIEIKQEISLPSNKSEVRLEQSNKESPSPKKENKSAIVSQRSLIGTLKSRLKIQEDIVERQGNRITELLAQNKDLKNYYKNIYEKKISELQNQIETGRSNFNAHLNAVTEQNKNIVSKLTSKIDNMSVTIAALSAGLFLTTIMLLVIIFRPS